MPTMRDTTLMSALIDDPEARAAFRSDPDGFARRLGVDMDGDTREALLSIDFESESMQLLRRVSKGCSAPW